MQKNLTDEEKMYEAILKIKENYANLEKSIVGQLSLAVASHDLTTGTFREAVWKHLFELIIPRKFCIEQGVFIIDSYGKVSREVDLAIFDEMYTPYIFNYGNIKFIPIEAVAVAIQCKSVSLEKQDLKKWAESVKILRTSLNSVCRTIGDLLDNTHVDKGRPKTQTATRPILILCATDDEKLTLGIKGIFDIVLHAKDGVLRKFITKEERDYGEWYEELNHCDSEQKAVHAILTKKLKRQITELVVQEDAEENVIMSLTFQLNQLLMLINNPILFPHKAYVDMFNKVTAKGGAITQ